MKCGALSVLGLAGVRALEAVPFDHHQLMGAGISDRSTNKGPSVIGTYGVDRERLQATRLDGPREREIALSRRSEYRVGTSSPQSDYFSGGLNTGQSVPATGIPGDS
jgi:hypothetical protein